MKEQHVKSVIVYHDVDKEGNHLYWFRDHGKKILLDWGETGHIPIGGDRFEHPRKLSTLRLEDILWADDEP